MTDSCPIDSADVSFSQCHRVCQYRSSDQVCKYQEIKDLDDLDVKSIALILGVPESDLSDVNKGITDIRTALVADRFVSWLGITTDAPVRSVRAKSYIGRILSLNPNDEVKVMNAEAKYTEWQKRFSIQTNWSEVKTLFFRSSNNE